MLPLNAVHVKVAPVLIEEPDKCMLELEQFNNVSGPALACTSEKLPKVNGPQISFSSEEKDDDERVLNINAPNTLEQGPVMVARSNPKSEKLMAMFTICSGSKEVL